MWSESSNLSDLCNNCQLCAWEPISAWIVLSTQFSWVRVTLLLIHQGENTEEGNQGYLVMVLNWEYTNPDRSYISFWGIKAIQFKPSITNKQQVKNGLLRDKTLTMGTLTEQHPNWKGKRNQWARCGPTSVYCMIWWFNSSPKAQTKTERDTHIHKIRFYRLPQNSQWSNSDGKKRL